MAKVLYDFAGQRENELTITANEIVEIVQKESNGKFDPFGIRNLNITNMFIQVGG
jgi:hypothetical protein